MTARTSSIPLTSKGEGYNYFTKVNHSSNDEFSIIKSVSFFESFYSPKTYGFIVTMNPVNGDSYGQWNFVEGPDYARGLKKFGNAYIDPLVEGKIYVELSSSSQLPAFIKCLKDNFEFSLPTYIEKSIYDCVGWYTPSNYTLISLGNSEKLSDIETYLKSGKLNINERDSNGNDLLHIAYDKNNFKLGETALKWGCYIDSKNDFGNTVIKLAVMSGDYDWYKWAAGKGASKIVKDANYDTLLHTAIKSYKNLLDVYNYNNDNAINYGEISYKGDSYKKIIHDLAHSQYDLIKLSNFNGENAITLASQIKDGGVVYNDLVNELKSHKEGFHHALELIGKLFGIES